MKERQDNFEKLLKKKSDEFKMNPSADSWLKIEQRIKGHKRSNLFRQWLMAATVLFTTVVATCFIVQHLSNKKQLENHFSIESSADRGNNADQKSDQVLVDKSNELFPSGNNIPAIIDKQITPNETRSASGQSQKMIKSNKPMQNKLSNGQADFETESLRTSGAQNTKEEKAFILPLPNKPTLTKTYTRESLILNPSTGNQFFSGINISGNRFYLDLNAMPAFTFINKNAVIYDSESMIITNGSADGNSVYYSGFSIGGNFIFQPYNNWFTGSGLSFTKTMHRLDIAEKTFIKYDTLFSAEDSGGNVVIENIDTAYSYHHNYYSPFNYWIDLSLFAGVNLFPESNNHIRLLAGAAYSRLISSSGLPVNVIESTANNNVNPMQEYSESFLAFNKNQLQFFTEANWVHDFSSRLSLNLGMQFHYYALNLYENNEFRQKMFWVGMKGGILLKL